MHRSHFLASRNSFYKNFLPRAILPQSGQRFLKVRGQRRFRFDDLAQTRMAKAQPAGMQRLPRHQDLIGFRLGIGRKVRKPR